MFSRLSHLALRTTTRAPPGRSYRRIGSIAAVSGSLLLTSGYIYADSFDNNGMKQSLGSLIRSYFVFTMCSLPPLVDYSPKILNTLMSVPGLRQVTGTLVRVTFFNHFVGGDTAEGTIPLLRAFRRANKGALLAYSVEVDPGSVSTSDNEVLSKDELPHKKIIKEIIHSIDVAADFENSVNDGGRRTWVAIKLTALVPDAQALVNLSTYVTASHAIRPDTVPFPGSPRSNDLDAILHPQLAPSSFSKDDITDLSELVEDLSRVCAHAKERGVKVIIDAEWSWYQSAIDAIALMLMRKFNALDGSNCSVQPLVYTTYQAYLRRTPSHLALSLADARKNNYALGVKLVRGAYHPYEVKAHKAKDSGSLAISPDELPPVWNKKAETDRCYNDCVKLLLNAVKEDTQQNSSSKTLVTTVNSNGNTKERNRFWSSWLAGYRFTKGAASSESNDTRLPSIGILFGTHNWESAKCILEGLLRNDLAVPATDAGRHEDGEVILEVKPEVVERVAIAQLYGMSDDLTQYLVDRTRAPTPFVIKYVPYGALEEVMPYLSRRAMENKSVLGDGKATEERRKVGREIWKRVTGG